MPTENKVFTKLFSDKKVELSGIDDLQTLTEKAEEKWSSFDDRLADFDSRYIELANEVAVLFNSHNIYVDSLNELENAKKEFENKANELGLDPMQVKEYANAELTISSYKANQSEIDQYLKMAELLDKNSRF